MNPKRRTINEMLRFARERKGLSGLAISRLSGKPSSYIYKLESGAISPTVALLEELCPHYGLEPWEAVAGMTRAELLASLPVARASPEEQAARELVQRWGAEAVRDLLKLSEAAPTADEFRELLTIYRVIRARAEGT